jgi:hypothetical protein
MFLDVIRRPILSKNTVLFIFQNNISETESSLRNVVLKYEQDGVFR